MDQSSFGMPQHVSFCLRKQTLTFDVTCRFYGNVLSWKNINQMHTESAQDISADVQRIDIFYFTNKSKAFSATFKTFLLVYIHSAEFCRCSPNSENAIICRLHLKQKWLTAAIKIIDNKFALLCLSVMLQVLYKLKTAKVFDKPRSKEEKSSTDIVDEDPFAIQILSWCPESRVLCVAGVSAHVIVYRFSKQEVTTEVVQVWPILIQDVYMCTRY